MINDSYQKISGDRLMKRNDSSGMISNSFRRLGFVTSGSFFFLCVGSLPSYYGRIFLSAFVDAGTTAFTDLLHGRKKI